MDLRKQQMEENPVIGGGSPPGPPGQGAKVDNSSRPLSAAELAELDDDEQSDADRDDFLISLDDEDKNAMEYDLRNPYANSDLDVILKMAESSTKYNELMKMISRVMTNEGNISYNKALKKYAGVIDEATLETLNEYIKDRSRNAKANALGKPAGLSKKERQRRATIMIQRAQKVVSSLSEEKPSARKLALNEAIKNAKYQKVNDNKEGVNAIRTREIPS